jgi:invasion protein IalB
VRHLFHACHLGTLAILLLFGTVAAHAQGLPGGASSLSETHRDWTVACAAPEQTVRCAITQTQVRGENGQRILAIELAPGADGGMAGTLVLPFGLRLDSGVRLMVDDNAPLPALRFSTCLPTGCLVPLLLDTSTLAMLRAGTTLGVMATANDNGEPLTLSVPLAGMGSALDRVVQLSGQ